LLATLDTEIIATALLPARGSTLASADGIAADLFAHVKRLRLPTNALLEACIAVLLRLPCASPTFLAFLDHVTDKKVLAYRTYDLEPDTGPDQAFLTSVRSGLHCAWGTILGDLEAHRCTVTGILGL
jgi:hypothetical protein